MSKEKFLILETSFFFKRGQIIEGKKTSKGLLTGEHLIKKGKYVSLQEALSRQDEEEIRKLVKEILQKMFYKLYIQSPIILNR